MIRVCAEFWLIIIIISIPILLSLLVWQMIPVCVPRILANYYNYFHTYPFITASVANDPSVCGILANYYNYFHTYPFITASVANDPSVCAQNSG